MIDIRVKATGPLFDGRAERAVERFVEDGVKALVAAGVKMVRQRFGARIRHSTGYFLGRVSGVLYGTYGKVWDRMLIYGRWLEGTGSRNRTTRFKGYHGYRDTAMVIDRDSEKILQPLMDKMVRELGGA